MSLSGYKQSSIPRGTDTGRQGFQEWECYMLLKYGNAGSFGLGGTSEYLIELPLYPDEVTESINAQWEEQSIIGRSSSIATYAGTSLKSVNFQLNLHRDFLTGSYSLTRQNIEEIASQHGKTADDLIKHNQSAGAQYDYIDGLFGGRSWYININKMLQMACYPQYTEYGTIPPTTYFIFGQMILKGFIESYSTTWKKPLLNTFYGNNTVNISMKCYPDSVISASDMIGSSSVTGNTSTQNTYNTTFPTKIGNSNVMARNFNRTNFRGSSKIGSMTDIMYT